MKQDNPSACKREYASGQSTVETVFEIVEKLQQSTPSQPVTKSMVFSRIKERRIELSYRQIGRVFSILTVKGRIVRESRGQYWLPKYLAINLEYLKRLYEVQKTIMDRLQTMNAKQLREFEEKLFLSQEREVLLDEQIEREEILRVWRKELAQASANDEADFKSLRKRVRTPHMKSGRAKKNNLNSASDMVAKNVP